MTIENEGIGVPSELLEKTEKNESLQGKNETRISGDYVEMSYKIKTYDVYIELPDVAKKLSSVRTISVPTEKFREFVVVGCFPTEDRMFLVRPRKDKFIPGGENLIKSYNDLLILPGSNVTNEDASTRMKIGDKCTK